MALPKAVVCILGDEPADNPVEAELRSTGFATFSITWKELDSVQNCWVQILPPLEDPTVVAWAIVGKSGDFTDSVRSKIALLSLAMERAAPPATVFILTDEGEIPELPYAMSHINVYRHTQKYAVELLVAKIKPQPMAPLPFFVKPHLDPLVGAWLEIAPPDNEQWDGFMAGVTQAEVSSFGVGPRGAIPTKSTLGHPILGIEGTIGKEPFHACAAKNMLSSETSCYMRLDGFPGQVFCMEYPEDEKPGNTAEREPVHLEFV